MPENSSNVPVQTSNAPRPVASNEWRPFGNLRREIDRLFDDFDRGAWGLPFRRSLIDWEPRWLGETAPAVDVAEKEKAYEITAELPGIDQNNVEVKLVNGVLTIKGEKKQETEEKKKNYYMSERRYGSFERSFQVPDGVDQDKIEASFNKGVLMVTLPKSVEAQKTAKTITVKAA
jgi:HSP20 family protein